MTKRISFSKTEKVLLCVIAVLAFILITGTIGGLIKKNKTSDSRTRIQDPAPTAQGIENLNKQSDEKIAAYTGLGTIRAITLADETKEQDTGTVVIVTPWLSYPENDTIFFEELARKRILLTGIINSYFSTRTQAQLLSLTEEKIKKELLIQINQQLSLGEISQVYFTDYLFIE